jgi:CDP-diacylglycerol--serine O-phosphatidyltransferase
VIFAAGSLPLTDFGWSVAWLALLAVLSFLMVSAWRYWSFKELNLQKPQSPLILVGMCLVIYGIWSWPKLVLVVLATIYVSSGFFIRVGGLVRRVLRPKQKPTPNPNPEVQPG